MTADPIDRILATVRARFDSIDARITIIESRLDALHLRLSWAEEHIAETTEYESNLGRLTI
jgi:hypothetical protein